MSYEDLRGFAGIAGLLIFMSLFIGVLVYVFWPGNKKRFDHARHIPLEDDPEDEKTRGKDGRQD